MKSRDLPGMGDKATFPFGVAEREDDEAGSQAENARPIAAVPELLEALKDYIRVIAQAGGGDKQLFMAAIRAAEKQLFMAAIRAADKQPAPPSPKQRRLDAVLVAAARRPR